MRLRVAFAQIALAGGLFGGVALAAGPSAGTGPWVICQNDSSVCASQLGPDLNPNNENFDCIARNGRPGHALQHSGTGAVHCWAF